MFCNLIIDCLKILQLKEVLPKLCFNLPTYFHGRATGRKGHCAHGISSVQHEFILLLSAALPDPYVVLEDFSFVANLGDEMR